MKSQTQKLPCGNTLTFALAIVILAGCGDRRKEIVIPPMEAPIPSATTAWYSFWMTSGMNKEHTHELARSNRFARTAHPAQG